MKWGLAAQLQAVGQTDTTIQVARGELEAASTESYRFAAMLTREDCFAVVALINGLQAVVDEVKYRNVSQRRTD